MRLENCPRFQWHLHSPFLPNEAKEAIFSFRHPIPTRWKATLRQTETAETTGYNLPIALSLQYIPGGEIPDEVCQVGLSVNIAEVGVEPRPCDLQLHSFKPDNQYTYTSNASVRRGNISLSIKVYFNLQNLQKACFEEDDVENLRDDLWQLLRDPVYGDVRLQSTPPDLDICVHSYILGTRWFHLRKELQIEPNSDFPDVVETLVPPAVLKDILTYVYTTSIDHFGWDCPPTSAYKTELFQVMDEYPLHHLHMRLEPKGKVHDQMTGTQFLSNAVNFKLPKADDSTTYVWERSLIPDAVEFTASLQFLLHANVLSFSYTLEFTSTVDVVSRVTLEYKREVVGSQNVRRTIVHDRGHEVTRNGRAKGEANVPHLREFIQGGDGTEGEHKVEHSFRFILCVFTKMTVIQIRKEEEKMPAPFDEEGLVLLSNHMSVVRRLHDAADLTVCVENPYPKKKSKRRKIEKEEHLLHKSMFVIRLRNYSKVFESTPEGFFTSAKCVASKGVFNYVIEFMYTGTLGDAPEELLPAIKDFAERNAYSSLFRAVDVKQYSLFLDRKQ